eukprot:1141602-Pelagomonas_calceolata.AAC.4
MSYLSYTYKRHHERHEVQTPELCLRTAEATCIVETFIQLPMYFFVNKNQVSWLALSPSSADTALGLQAQRCCAPPCIYCKHSSFSPLEVHNQCDPALLHVPIRGESKGRGVSDTKHRPFASVGFLDRRALVDA